MIALLVSSQLAYEGFLGDPLGVGIRYGFRYDSLYVAFRGGTGIGGFLSYFNIPFMGDLVLNVRVNENTTAYMGGGVITGFRFIGGFDAGIGIRILVGAEFKATDRLGLGFEFAPLVVKSFSGKAHPGVSFGLRAAYYPVVNKTEERMEPETLRTQEGGNPEVREVRGEVKKQRVSGGMKHRGKEGERNVSTSGRTRQVDAKAAENEYKLGLQAYANGDLHKAKLHFEAALRYNPHHEKARMALEKVRRQLGER